MKSRPIEGRHAAVCVAPTVLLAALVVACDRGSSESSATPASGVGSKAELDQGEARATGGAAEDAAAPAGWADVPQAMKPCFSCHRDAVISYLGHGMSRSIGPVGEPPPGIVDNPRSGNRYEIRTGGGAAWLDVALADGGVRTQQLVGRIGAGVLDTSWVSTEIDTRTGEATGRLFFAPVETITDHGHELSPFELAGEQAGPDFALTEGCLTCHTTDRLADLAGAATAEGAASGGEVFPANALGVDAFDVLSPLTCDACHGDSRLHVEVMTGQQESLPDDIAIARLGDLPASTQLDVCARCHLQGDARIDLVRTDPDRDHPLGGQIPILVASRAGKDFRFVSQLERLVLSQCFQGTAEMTCTTCHLPHSSAAEQGPASFDAACSACHDHCSRPESLPVEQVTGEPARSEAGCVDCHVRRSQPFDLPHVRSADHHIRRRIELPEELPHRQFADPTGPLVLYDDGRLAAALDTPGGRRWRAGALAMGLMSMGRLDEAGAHFADFPAPGSPEATQPSAPRGLLPFETYPSFHQVRALSLMASGQFEQALAAFSDALQLDPLLAGARLGRAQLRLDRRDVAGALEDTQAVIDAYPRAEQPWGLRASLAERIGRPDLAASAFEAYVLDWPSNATVWTKLGLLRRQRGDAAGAAEALDRARSLSPSLRLPGAAHQ